MFYKHQYGSARRFIALIVLLLVVFAYLARHSSEKYTLPVEQACHDSARQVTPKPLIVYVGGGSRTGTTYVYNLLRILLRQRDPNLIHGWYEDLSIMAARYASPNPPTSPVFEHKEDNLDQWKGSLEAYRHSGTTLLVKVHSLAHAIRLFDGCDHPHTELQDPNCPVDFIISTHRDLGPQLASIRRMGWARRVYERDVNHDPAAFCRQQRSPTPRLTRSDWEHPTTWTIQGRAIVVCNSEWHKAAGSKLALEVGMETLQKGYDTRVELARNIVKELERRDGRSVGRMDAPAAVQEADLLRPLSCQSWQAVHPITHFHRGHVQGNQTMEDQEVIVQAHEALEKDPYIQTWRHSMGYATTE